VRSGNSEFPFPAFRKSIFLQKTKNMSSDSNQDNIKNSDEELPKNYEVTAQGSLGLLALGAVGIKAWRKKRKEEEEKQLKTKKENE
jgi:hypothetical protein